jgi:tetratricopeptide (TPR) repeat protein
MGIPRSRPIRRGGRLLPAAALAALLLGSGLATFAAPPVPANDADQGDEAGGGAEAAYRAGMDALRDGDAERAEAALRRAVELDPDLGKGWLQLGIVRSRAQDWDGAIAAYTRLIELEPDNPKAPHNLANVQFRRGDHEEAARWYARALELDPDYMLAAFHYGWMLRELNRPEEAERWFSRCSELEGTDRRENKTRLDCLFYLGALRFRARDYEQAASIMERVVTMFPGHPEARYYLGMSYRQLGRTAEAERQLEMHNHIINSIRGDEPIEKRP